MSTISPIATIVEPVAGENVHVLLPPGASPHIYDPRPSDMRAAASVRVLFFGSMELDGWAASLETRKKVALLDLVPDSLRLGEPGRVDPHFWMDPLTVLPIVPAIAETLCREIPEKCETYRRNADEFVRELTQIHDSVSAIIEPVRGSVVLLTHPFLGYFARRYGLKIAGVIEEIPGSEPTPQDMERMVHLARDSRAEAIFSIPQHPSRAARAVAEVTGVPVIGLDPIGGDSNRYAELLYFNARKIRSALSENRSQF